MPKKPATVTWQIKFPAELEERLIEALCERGAYYKPPPDPSTPKQFAQGMLQAYARQILLSVEAEKAQMAAHTEQADEIADAFKGVG